MQTQHHRTASLVHEVHAPVGRQQEAVAERVVVAQAEPAEHRVGLFGQARLSRHGGPGRGDRVDAEPDRVAEHGYTQKCRSRDRERAHRASLAQAAGSISTSSAPSFAVTRAVEPSGALPESSARASRVSTSRWMKRRSGRAPNTGSKPSRAIRSSAAGLELERDLPLGQPAAQVLEQEPDDLLDLGGLQRLEQDGVVHPVQELGPEVRAQLLEHGVARDRLDLALRVHALEQERRADVAGHDDDGVAEVDGAARASR